jgi:hypothetical protein
MGRGENNEEDDDDKEDEEKMNECMYGAKREGESNNDEDERENVKGFLHDKDIETATGTIGRIF